MAKFSLIICTYMRPEPLLSLLNSVRKQSLYPNEILIVDGSTNTNTKIAIENNSFENLRYYSVDDKDRGLTKQRNFGIKNCSKEIEIICFLDDDTILEPEYFENLLKTYKDYPNALGVGGYITNEVVWWRKNEKDEPNVFEYDGWERKEPLRFRVRKWFGLHPNTPPCVLPKFSHGRSVSFLPPTGKTYKVEQFMGGVSSFKKEVFDKLSFSTYFEGYGLYEDADFTLRLSKLGDLYVNTAARLEHHHAASGRPNQYKYGKMVIRNGWYVWRVRHPKPGMLNVLKWYLTAILLTKIKLLNVITTKDRRSSWKEFLGRSVGLFNCIFYIKK